MLTLPDGPSTYRIMSIDPGTNTLGVAVLDLCLINYTVDLVFVNTIQGMKNARSLVEFEESFGSRQAKLHTHHRILTDLILKTKPNAIVSEAPYMGRFAQAFEALVQCLIMIQSAIGEYDPWLVLETIDPMSVKKAVGVSKKGSNKDLVRDAVLGLRNLTNSSDKPLPFCDEHSIDAIAVGFWKLQQIDKSIVF